MKLKRRCCLLTAMVKNLVFRISISKWNRGRPCPLKDRGTALCVLKALEFGCKTVCLSSSGNNAASVSAYGSRAGLNPVVFVQKHVSAAKIFKSLVYGGRVVRIDGDMAAASRICGEMVKRRKWFSAAAQILTASPRSVPLLTASSSSLGGPRIRF